MNEFFFSALSFGLAAGLKPGPLGIVVIQQTLSRGLPSGVRASLAPLVTDGPIIIAALWLLSQFKSINLFAAALSLVGGLYLLWLSRKMFRVQNISISSKLGSSSSLGTAVKVNLLNPGPYLFWFTVGGSYIVRGTTTESMVFVANRVTTSWVTIIFGDKGKYWTWLPGTWRPTHRHHEASPGHKRCRQRVTSASTVSSGPT
jgi:threonine/homoserine/homoserine lactone efflux protein